MLNRESMMAKNVNNKRTFLKKLTHLRKQNISDAKNSGGDRQAEEQRVSLLEKHWRMSDRTPDARNGSGESWDPDTGAGVLERLTEGGLTRLGSDVLWFGQSWCDMDTSAILNTPWRHLSRDRFGHLGSLSLFVSLTHTHKLTTCLFSLFVAWNFS